MINVTQTGQSEPLEFRVTVSEADGDTTHVVTISKQDCTRLCGETQDAFHCVEAIFRFLLDREPKEAIMARFDVQVVSRYFPEFEAKLPYYLAG